MEDLLKPHIIIINNILKMTDVETIMNYIKTYLLESDIKIDKLFFNLVHKFVDKSVKKKDI
jgi:hypothetical protein